MIGWWIVLGLSVVVYIILAGFVCPKTILKAGYALSASADRGLRNYKENRGRTVLYEPQPALRKYIRQYILSDRGGRKVIVCKINEKISFLDYDVALFNSRNEVFRVLNVKEEIEKVGYTRAVDIPKETAYVTVLVNHVNGVHVGHDAISRVSNARLALFAAITAALVLLEIIAVKFCLAKIFGDVFYESFMLSTKSNVITILIGLAAVSINMAIAVVTVKSKSMNRSNYGGLR